VVWIWLWPRRSITAFRSAPPASSHEAYAPRRSLEAHELLDLPPRVRWSQNGGESMVGRGRQGNAGALQWACLEMLSEAHSHTRHRDASLDV
jgi:hypothetical protein